MRYGIFHSFIHLCVRLIKSLWLENGVCKVTSHTQFFTFSCLVSSRHRLTVLICKIPENTFSSNIALHSSKWKQEPLPEHRTTASREAFTPSKDSIASSWDNQSICPTNEDDRIGAWSCRSVLSHQLQSQCASADISAKDHCKMAGE